MKILNQKNNFESEIAEQGLKTLLSKGDDLATLRAQRPQAAMAIDDIVAASKGGLGKPIITKNGTTITTSEELAIALRDFTLAPKELGRVEKGFLKSASTDGDLRRVIASKFAKDKRVLDELAKYNYKTVADIKKYLDSKYYHKSSIDEIIKQMKSNGAIDAKGLLVKNAANVGKGGKTSKSLLTRTKELLNNIKIKKMSWKQLLIWGAGIGISGYALWYFIKETSDVIPDDMPTTPPSQDWGACLGDLLSLKKAQIAKSPSGEISVYTPKTEKYPGGLNFYSNGRVMNTQTKEMGTWKCVAGQAQVNESVSNSKVNESLSQMVKRVLNERYLIEQSTSQIDSDVEDMIDYLDVPVWGNDYKNIYNLLKKYGSNGKFNEFKEIYEESGFMKTSLRSDISTIYAIDASSVRMKKQILSLLDQIESGKYVQAPPTPSTTTTTNTNTGQRKPQETVINEQNRLDIVWDKDKAGGGNTTRKTYYDCSSVNLDTTPLTYGCKDPRIGQIQGCLGVTPDGKFGPITRKSLLDDGFDVKNGITKDIFNKVLSMCKTSKVGEMSDEDKARVNYLKTPIKLDLGPVPQMPAKNDSSNFIQPTDTVTKTLSPTNESGQNFYNRLEGNGNFEDGKFGDKRARYKGNNLNDEDLGKLDEFFRANGYERRRPRITGKNYGEKYVWIKQ
jgi:hypothetical protein